ncbi:MAG: hypothetical protein IRY85_07085 [Micromonosporaceae bacterium]|nr:hypothetical protein [Micromonosporaceae bacterium]
MAHGRRGAASTNSDIDIWLYYEPGRRPEFDELYEAIVRLDDRGAPDGHGRHGEWGPWINGGVWLRIGGHKTDILLRDLRRVEQVLFAVERRYLTNEKGGVAIADRFPTALTRYADRVAASSPGCPAPRRT